MTAFRRSGMALHMAGWKSVFPLPFGKKGPPPEGVTGANGQNVKPKQIKRWLDPRLELEFWGDDGKRYKYFPGVSANVALRLPKDIIGIDIDWHNDPDVPPKPGKETYEEAVKLWGPLPDTWRSSARDDGVSGILLFKVPKGLAWPGNMDALVGRGIDFIRWDHRYMLVEPSLHPKVRSQYRWYDKDGKTGSFPSPDDIPDLPKKWVQGITNGERWVERPAAMEMDTDDSNAWMDDRNNDSVCSHMESLLSAAIARVTDATSSHDTLNEAVWQLVKDAGAGHGGGVAALASLRAAFLEDVTKRRKRTESVAKREWSRSFLGAVQKAAMLAVEPDDPCALYEDSGRAERTERVRSRGSSLYDFKRDDIGNAQRLVNRCGDDMRWCEALGGWFAWDAEARRWKQSAAQIRRWAMETVRSMGDELKYLHDEPADVQKAFAQHINSSGNSGRLSAMVDLASTLKGIEAEADLFDGDPRKLLTPNGLVVLGKDGLSFRTPRREDYVTVATSGSYVPGSWEGTPWVDFLDRFVPDLEVRHWAQKAVGYSLLGANPHRLLFFVNGKTSSGKSTFGEAIRDSLGKYAAAFNLNLFKELREAGAPNVQLVRMLPKRFILASEASGAISLSADQLKRMTGAEMLSGRLNKANEIVEQVPSFTPWIGTNGMPTIVGADAALARRMRVIPFDETIAEADEDHRVAEWLKTPEGHTAVLSWALTGWDLYVKEGLTPVPASILSATLKAKEDLSDLNRWMAECCDVGEGLRERAKDLYDAYHFWCVDNNIKPETGTTFGNLLRGMGYDKKQDRIGERSEDRKAIFRMGIQLKSTEPRS